MVNTVLQSAGSWLNADGLVVRFGRTAQEEAVGGAPWTQSDRQKAVWNIVWDRLPKHQAANTTGMIYGGYPNQFIPAGAYIISALLTCTTSFSTTSSPTLTLGLVDVLGTDVGGFAEQAGFWSAQAASGLAAGDVLTSSGALVNATLPTTYDSYYLWATVGTADFTAGQARLVVDYFTPQVDLYNS